MNLEKEKMDSSGSKTIIKVIVVLIALVLIFIVGILGYASYVQTSQLVVVVNSGQNAALMSSLVFKEDGSIYVPLRSVAEACGYATYNGEYYNKSESTGKCYIESELQSVDFAVNSTQIFRVAHQSSYNKEEYAELKNPIIYIDNQMYINSEDLQTAMHATFMYDESRNLVEITSIEAYIESYAAKALEVGFEEFDTKYENAIGLLDGILVGKSNEKYGCINLYTGETILEQKYDDITYLRGRDEFLVKSSGKYGIITLDKKTKIESVYEEIDVLDVELGMYVVKKDGRYGILDNAGAMKVYYEYEQIGVDLIKFAENNIENKYLLGNNLIPIKKDSQWGFINLNFEVVTDFQFTSLGYVNSVASTNIINLLVIKDYQVIVVEKDGKYSLVGPDGTVLYPVAFEKIYMSLKEGYEKHYVVFNDEIIDAVEAIERKEVYMN